MRRVILLATITALLILTGCNPLISVPLTDAGFNPGVPTGSPSPGPATQFVFTTEPSNSATAGSNFATQPVVAAQDNNHNTDKTFSNSIALVPYSDSGCHSVATGLLSGSATTSAGIASFIGETFSQAETIYLKASNAYDDFILGDGPTGYWKLNENSGTSAVDSSANSYTGTYEGGFTLGESGPLTNSTDTSTLFDGSTGYVSTSILPGFAANLYTTGMSLDVWFKTSNTTGGENLLGTDGASNYLNLGLTINSDGNGGYAQDYIRFVLQDNSTNYFLGAIYYPALTDGNWHNLIITANLSAQTMTMTIDGVNQAITDLRRNGVVNNWEDFTAPFFIGAMDITGWPSGYFSGTIGQVSLYNYPLSPTQIANHYFAAHNSDPVLSAGCSSAVVVNP